MNILLLALDYRIGQVFPPRAAVTVSRQGLQSQSRAPSTASNWDKDQADCSTKYHFEIIYRPTFTPLCLHSLSHQTPASFNLLLIRPAIFSTVGPPAFFTSSTVISTQVTSSLLDPHASFSAAISLSGTRPFTTQVGLRLSAASRYEFEPNPLDGDGISDGDAFKSAGMSARDSDWESVTSTARTKSACQR